MKRFAIAALALLCCQPAAMARHLHTRDGFEVEPSHCTHDAVFDSWNCWYTPVKKRRRRAWTEYHDHHHVPHYQRYIPYFIPNRHNNHGTPCYFYKDDNWCF
tara:strand:- start:5872 stop:6177 length:306 start_codon:yes stop_codon:yes gene_type:complete